MACYGPRPLNFYSAMKRFIIFFSFLSVLSGCTFEDVEVDKIRPGDSIPAFEVVMNDGTVINDSSLSGSVSMIMFFYTLCPDCQKTLPSVQRIYDEYVSKGVKIVLISREEGEETISSYWKENSFNMPYSAQNDKVVYNKFASTRIPRIYISDEKRTVRYIFTDDPIPSYDDLKSSIESLIR